MPTRLTYRLLPTAVLLLVLAATVGCDDVRSVRPSAPPCTNSADYSERRQPYRSVAIDPRQDFHASREQLGPTQEGHTAFFTWDECHLYFGFRGPSFGPQASAHRYLVIYLDTDPLGDAGSADPRPLMTGLPRLPFKADYAVEVRTDGHMAPSGGQAVYRGNEQMYRRSIRWTAGLIRHWEAMGAEALTVGAWPDSSYLEIALARASVGPACAVQLLAWIVDTRSGDVRPYWPSPYPAGTHGRGDSRAVNYYGFQLLHDVRPAAAFNLNRTDYNAVGACAYGEEEELGKQELDTD